MILLAKTVVNDFRRVQKSSRDEDCGKRARESTAHSTPELLSDELQEIDVSRGELARALGVVQVFAS